MERECLFGYAIKDLFLCETFLISDTMRIVKTLISNHDILREESLAESQSYRHALNVKVCITES